MVTVGALHGWPMFTVEVSHFHTIAFEDVYALGLVFLATTKNKIHELPWGGATGVCIRKGIVCKWSLL